MVDSFACKERGGRGGEEEEADGKEAAWGAVSSARGGALDGRVFRGGRHFVGRAVNQDK
jgi:hypothetical protein